LIDHGYVDADYIIVGILHDAFEDTNISISMVEQLFGPSIARDAFTLSKTYGIEDPLTGFVTHSQKREKSEYFAAIKRRGKRTSIVKCADRVHNLSDLIDPPADSRWTPEKRLAQVAETREWILPLAQIHDLRFAENLEHFCALIEAKATQTP
jgi:(p)ppGpp synthase/HD superfamily hydrolase